MLRSLDPVLFPEETLSSFYRFSLLVTGEAHAAEQLLAESLAEVEMRIGHLRSVHRRKAWLIRRLRQRLASMDLPAVKAPRLLRENVGEGKGDAVLEIEAYILAQHFATLEEPDRSALALFYLNLFPARELPELLDLELEDLARSLDRGRQQLRASLRGQAALSLSTP